MISHVVRHTEVFSTQKNKHISAINPQGLLRRLSRALQIAVCFAFLFNAHVWEASAAPPSAPSKLSARKASPSQINLTWRDNSNDETLFKVERATDYGGPWTQVATAPAGSTSFSDNGLIASKFYCYRVRASSSTGDTGYSNVSGDVTLTPPTTPPTPTTPAAPSALAATVVSASQINLTWADNSSNETGFKLERSISDTGPWSLVATVGAGVTSFSNTGLTGSTAYFYRVSATNTAGDSVSSNAASATTLAVASSISLQLVVTGNPATQDYTVEAVTDAGSVLRVEFWVDGTLYGTESYYPYSLFGDAGVGSLVAGSLGAGTHAIEARVFTATVGASTPAKTDGITVTEGVATPSVPSAPGSLSASAVSTSQINLAWMDNSINETGFKIERAFAYGGPWTQVATVGAGVTSYTDSSLASTFYCYRVRASNAGGDSAYSTISGDTTLAGSTPPVTIPTAPSGLAATAVSASQINLTWVDGSNNETGFKIECALSASGPWTQIASTGAGVTSYNNTGLSASTLCYYRVRATNSAGDSSYSNQAATTTLAATPPPSTVPNTPSGLSASAISLSQINLAWVDNGGSATGFKIERALTASGPWTQVATTSAGVTSYANTGLLASTLYCYRVRAYNSVGDSGYTSVASSTTLAAPTPPPAGGNLSIPSSHPRLWWNAARLAQARAYFTSHSFTPSSGDPFALALAYQMTGNASYARTAINWLVAYQIPAGQATPSAVGSDNARWDGENAVIVFDWCWDQMTASERSTVINNWNTWLGNINQQYWGGVGMEMNNYYWGNLRNSLEWGIATYGENSQAQNFINHALQTRWQNSFIPLAAAAGKGGVLQEGPGYGAVTAWYPTIPFTSCALLGRNVWNESPFFKETVMYMVYATTPAPTTRKGDSANSYELFPFNDSEYPQNGSIFNIRKYHGDFMTTAANQWSSTGIGQYARRWVNVTQPNTSWHVKSVDNGGAEQSYSNLPLDYFASGTRYLFARNVWGSTSTAVNLLMGNPTGVGHAHRDIGSFQIWRNGKWVSRNTGGYSNSIIGYGGGSMDVSMPSAHNVVLINGVGQLADSWVKGDPTMLRLESKPGYIYAAVDLTQIYKANADFAGRVPEAPINSYIREYVFVRSTETLYVCDRIDSSSSVTATFLLHSETSTPLFSSTAKVGTPSATRTVDEGVSGVGQYRFEYDYAISGKGYFVRAISPSGVSDSSVTFNANGVGGTFNGTAFGTGIATCTVTDNGPVWNP